MLKKTVGGKRFNLSERKDLEEFRKRLKKSLQSVGLMENQIEDAISDLILRVQKGFGKKQTFDQMAMDWMRLNLGHKTRSKYKHTALRSIVRDYGMLSRIPEKEDSIGIIEKIALADAISKLKNKRIRVIMRLYAFWGLTRLEIGQLFEITEAQVSRLIIDATQHIKSKIEREVI